MLDQAKKFIEEVKRRKAEEVNRQNAEWAAMMKRIDEDNKRRAAKK